MSAHRPVSDSNIAIDDGSWDAAIFNGHAIGCNAVSWAPAVLPGSLVNPTPPAQQGPNPNSGPSETAIPLSKRFASAGCDNVVRIWNFSTSSQSWVEEAVLSGHTDWVRDVAWAPNIGLPRSYIATASQDRTVLIWTKDGPNAQWQKTALDPSTISSSVSTAPGGGPAPPAQPGKFPDVVWRVSWSLAGNILAVSCGDGKVTLWKENLKGGWDCVNELAS